MGTSIRSTLSSFCVGFILFSGSAFAIDPAFVHGIYSPPIFSGSERSLDPLAIRIVQWNVHMYDTAKGARWNCSVAKGEDSELCLAFSVSDIALIEEATYANDWRDRSDAVLGLQDKHLAFAPYAVDGNPNNREYYTPLDRKLERGLLVRDPEHNGSATFSRVPPLSSTVKLSQNSDNFWPFYMPVLATTYALKGRAERLLVVHMHNLAGVGSDRQLELLDEAEKLIAAHTGPVVFAGDFNSATTEKMQNLYWLAERQGLAEVRYNSPFPTPFGNRQLDHTFVRGLLLVDKSTRVFGNSNRLSDHFAIAYELMLPR